MAAQNYPATNIRILSGIMHIRARPKMYLGPDNNDGMLYIIKELLKQSNSRPQFKLNPDQSITIILDGYNWSIKEHSKVRKPIIEILFTEFGAGGRDNMAPVVINALSEKAEVITRVGSSSYRLLLEKGEVVLPLHRIDQALPTQITFKLDLSLFKGDQVFDIGEFYGMLDPRLGKTFNAIICGKGPENDCPLGEVTLEKRIGPGHFKATHNEEEIEVFSCQLRGESGVCGSTL